MPRLLALCMLLVFATLVATDEFACPDGHQTASSAGAAGHHDVQGNCVFCNGGSVVVPAEELAQPTFVVLATVERPDFTRPLPPHFSLERPPRHS